MHHFTNDAKLLTRAQIGRKRHMTTAGFMVCEQVPIARTGELLYGANELKGTDGETAIVPGAAGIINVTRTADELFSPTTISSFEGMPFTLDHPVEMVTPKNYRSVVAGTAVNVRPGDGTAEDYAADTLYADLLVTDQKTMDTINREDSGRMREISLGYSADYEQTAPGRAIQRNIVGNHIALVKRGRNGSRIAIGDKEIEMDENQKPATGENLLERLMGRIFDRGLATLDRAEPTVSPTAEAPVVTTGTTTVDALGAKIDALPGLIATAVAAALKPAEPTTPTADNATVHTHDAAFLSRVEVLAPGTKPAGTDAPEAVKRTALATAMTTDTGRALITPMLNGKTVATADAATIDVAFIASAEAVKAMNNAAVVRPGSNVGTRDNRRPTEQMQETINKYWAERGVKN